MTLESDFTFPNVSSLSLPSDGKNDAYIKVWLGESTNLLDGNQSANVTKAKTQKALFSHAFLLAKPSPLVLPTHPLSHGGVQRRLFFLSHAGR